MKLTHIKGIDSIRSVGVVIVVIYHLFTNLLPGGFFGVDVFFVISGFLVTSLLMSEQQENGRIDLIKFYVRRVRRLLPSAAFMVVITLALSLLLEPDLRVGMRAQTAAVFGWMTNYFEIAAGGSYEDQFLPHLFVHTWTLGVEMHYYLIWGAILTLVCFFWMKYNKWVEHTNSFIYGMNRTVVPLRSLLLIICAGIALYAYLLMRFRFPGLDDPSPVYYATSTRIYPLMIGSALGLLTGMRVPQRRLPAPLALLLLLGSMLIILMMARSFSFSAPETYSYGILVVSLLTMLSVFSILSLQSLKNFKDLKLFAALGKRSYSIYLFHWPFYNIFRQMSLADKWPFSANTPHLVYSLLAIAATLVLAEISYRMFEARPPVKAVKNTVIKKRIKAVPQRKARKLAGFVAPVFCICAVISVFTLFNAPARTSIETDYLHQQVLVNIHNMGQYNDYLAGLEMDPVAMHNRTDELPTKPSEIANAQDVEGDAEKTQENAGKAINRDNPAGPVKPILPPGGANVTVIGDSVTLGAADIIIQTLGSVVVDAEVSRSMGAGPTLITQYAERGELGEYIVLALFTNVQHFTESATAETLDVIPPGHRVICVTPFGKEYMEETADMVRGLPKSYEYVTVADWNAAIRDHADLLAPDRLHMKGDDSRQIYANLLAQAIEQASKKPAKK